jgi:hypothetical protein
MQRGVSKNLSHFHRLESKIIASRRCKNCTSERLARLDIKNILIQVTTIFGKVCIMNLINKSPRRVSRPPKPIRNLGYKKSKFSEASGFCDFSAGFFGIKKISPSPPLTAFVVHPLDCILPEFKVISPLN